MKVCFRSILTSENLTNRLHRRHLHPVFAYLALPMHYVGRSRRFKVKKTLNVKTIRFDQAMFEIYHRAKEEAGYNANIFPKMISDNGGLQAARTLINASRPSDGYTALYERGRLDLTVEAMIVENPIWHELFLPDELERAKRRLQQYDYKPKA